MTPTERDDLNKRIAEDLGWAFKTRKGSITVFEDDDYLCAYPIKEPFDCEDVHAPGCVCPPNVVLGDCVCAKMPNFFADAVYTLLLMRKILAEGRSIHFELVDATKNYVVLSSEFISLKDRIKTCGAIGEAVALAYAAMRNLK